jgi:uncharacterized protein YndB with AHSA1/START domain
MQKLHQKIFINAPREKVWNTMLDDATYREWTKEFCPGSYYKGNWEQGTKMLFIGPDEANTTEMGMVSTIKENRKPEFISVEHLGIYKDGVEDTTSDEAKKWAPAFENYTFIEKDGGTELHIDMDIQEEQKATFEEMWAKALVSLKDLCEK